MKKLLILLCLALSACSKQPPVHPDEIKVGETVCADFGGVQSIHAEISGIYSWSRHIDRVYVTCVNNVDAQFNQVEND